MVEVIESGGALGAEIRGVDLRKPFDAATAQAVKDAFYRHEVVYFRGQDIDDDDQIRFSAHFGEVRQTKFTKLYENDAVIKPEIFVVSNIKRDGAYIGAYDAGLFWHTDGAFLKHPHIASALRAIEVPEADGRTLGDTRYASMTAAYQALPQAMKKRLHGLQVLHTVMLRFKKTVDSGIKKDEFTSDIKQEAEAIHALVKPHPVTGRLGLFISEGYASHIVGMPEDESRALLAELNAFVTQPQFQYLHNWRAKDLVLWDDCTTLHKATFDYALPQRRLMHRTTIG
jgi:taurine dioxygenase